MPKLKQKSITRNHFEKVDNETSKCKLCGKNIKVGGGTSNMLAHLKRNHPQATVPVNQEEPESAGGNLRPSIPLPSHQEQPQKTSIQSKLNMTVGSNKKKIDEYLTLMIATDFQPYSIVEDSGFQKFVAALNPSYVLPTRQKIRYDLMPLLYTKAKSQLAALLQSTEYVALTTDLWSNQTMDSYITVTVHFFIGCHLKSYVLTTSDVPTNHSSQELAEIMTNIISEWKLVNKISAIVTDNASNMVKMCDLLGIRHMPCFAHTLNLTIDDALELVEVQEIVEKCKIIVKFFKKSSVGWRALKLEQKEKNPNAPPLKLIQHVKTRWNSTFYMLKRLLRLSDELAVVCRKLVQAPDFLSACEENIAKEVVNVLEIFDEATKLVSADQYPTSSLIIPVICGLYENLNTIEISLDTDIGKMFCSAVKRHMSTRLLIYESRTVTQVSTYLHPNFRNGFRHSENMLSAKELVRRELSNLLKDHTPNLNVENSVKDEETTTKTPGILDFLKKRSRDPANSTASAINMLRMYLESNCEGEGTEAVGNFWQNTKYLVPLNKIAFKYLAVPATSVPSERMFSTSGYVLSSRRSRLLDDAVDQLCFLHQNKNLIDL